MAHARMEAEDTEHTPEPALAAGPFTTSQARELGFKEKQLYDLERNRAIRRVFNGVYVPAAVPDTLETRIAAVKLVRKPFVVLRDRTAAWVWGVDTFDYRELEILPPLEFSSLRGHTRTRRKGCDGGIRDLKDVDIVEIDGVLITTPARTAIDLACKDCRRPGGRRKALARLDAFMRVCDVTHDDMHKVLLRFRGRRGVRQARSLVPIADPRAESQGESWPRLEILDHGLPAPELQHWVSVDGYPTYRLDMAYPKHRVAIEYDGREFHEGVDENGHDRRERDEARRAWLREHGWTVIVLTKDDFTPAAIERWISQLRSALGLVD
jgi:hypothetical protein